MREQPKAPLCSRCRRQAEPIVLTPQPDAERRMFGDSEPDADLS